VLEVSPDKEVDLVINVRIPGWAIGHENPFGLYRSDMNPSVGLKVNGKVINATPVNGYISINRKWKTDDKIELELPMTPRFVYANEKVIDLAGQVAIASGPIVYGLEKNKNPEFDKVSINSKAPMEIQNVPDLLGGVNVITGKTSKGSFTAIPYFAIGNIKPGDSYKVWVRYE